MNASKLANIILSISGTVLVSLGTNWKVGVGMLILAVYIRPERE